MCGTPKVDAIWVDECGQLEITLWAQLGKL